ncbi:desert hedgehog protein B-like [Gigantopelta aegis]|uniref:desert hedgehog protein B-like n=1 Tax=Gigantopelta aegis TaxID=1735272 RepID=UPI001B88E66B|nr:desert hedgehog protein B-like [Gigantopelta aegis]
MGKTLVITCGDRVLSIPHSKTTSSLQVCSHEEANTKILFHLADCAHEGLKKILIPITDTEILLLAVGCFQSTAAKKSGMRQEKEWDSIGHGALEEFGYTTRRPPPRPSGDTSCFPGEVRLLLESGNAVFIENVRAGQRILTVQNGRRVFSEVRTFLKRLPNKNATYLTLTTEQGNHVTMSDNHQIFVSTTNKSTDMQSGRAISVRQGDYIFTTKSCNKDLCPERVIQVSVSLKQGLYVPITDAGTLVVDGIFASCYSLVPHDLEHLLVTPFRWFPWLLHPWQEDGYSPIMSSLEYLALRFLPEGLFQSGL